MSFGEEDEDFLDDDKDVDTIGDDIAGEVDEYEDPEDAYH